MSIKKVVLAYSGGLDTSAIVPWLKDNYDCEVIAFVANVGQGDEELAGVEQKAINSGASSCYIVDLREEFVKEVIYPTLKTGAVYDDIALEYWSNFGARTPGWVCKPLRADFIAYAIAPLGKCYLLPVIQLQIAWDRCGEHWIDKYPPIHAKNASGYGGSYTTVSVGVPVKDVFREIGGALRVTFQPSEAAA